MNSNPEQVHIPAAVEAAQQDRVVTPPAPVQFGAHVPSDMTVHLVRADAAGWEIGLSCAYSLFLALGGLFAGCWISDAQLATPHFTVLEKIATVVFSTVALVLVLIWILLKYRQSKKSIRVPLDYFAAFPH